MKAEHGIKHDIPFVDVPQANVGLTRLSEKYAGICVACIFNAYYLYHVAQLKIIRKPT